MDEEDRSIVDELNLSEEQISGVEKFLEALGLRSNDYIEMDRVLSKKFFNPPENNKDDHDYINLTNQMQEFFPCFILIGYDIEGNDFVYQYSSNPMTESAIEKKFREVSNMKIIQESNIMHLINMMGGPPEDQP